MDIISLTLTGHLTADATINVITAEKSVINFTVASNLDAENTVYNSCSYWVKTISTPEEGKENKEDKKSLVKLLKKGTKITVSSNYIKKTTSTAADGTVYNNLAVTVNKISI